MAMIACNTLAMDIQYHAFQRRSKYSYLLLKWFQTDILETKKLKDLQRRNNKFMKFIHFIK